MYIDCNRALSSEYEPPGSPASPQGVKVLLEDYNLNMESHRSKLLTIQDVDEAFLIIPVKRDLGEYILQSYPVCTREKIKYFNQDISDPWRSSESVFRACAKNMFEQLKEIAKYIPVIIDENSIEVSKSDEVN